MRRLKELSLSDNNLDDLDDSVFQAISSTLERLYLANNKFATIRAAVLNLESLQHLDLSDNYFKSLPNDAFIHLKRLESINLNDNALSAIPEALRGLTSLDDLELADNRIMQIDTHILSTLTRLEELDLSQNFISSIPSGAFDSLRSLKELHLDDNDIRHIEGNVFAQNRNLKKLIIKALELAGMALTTLPIGIFDNLADLEELDLGYNQLKTLDSNIFRNLFSLETLLLAENGIESLSPELFYGLRNLNEIDLSGNELTTLETHVFRDCLNLEKLDIASNKFVTFNLPQMSFAKTLLDLDISDNMLTTITVTEDLESLFANDNQITGLESVASPSHDLTMLSLANNRLSDVSTILMFTDLEYLNISRNNFNQLDLGRLTGSLDELEVLNVSHCGISSLGNPNIANQESMKVLDLSHNELPSLPLEVLKHFPEMEMFVLGGNKFEDLDADRLIQNFKDMALVGVDGTEWNCGLVERAARTFEDNDIGFWSGELPVVCSGRAFNGVCCK
ncbi:hypothetical protein quinque_003704 [Culex quinquefasciatus]